MKVLTIIFFLAFAFQEIPFKPKDEFEITLDYKFKQRSFDTNTKAVYLDETNREHERRTSTAMLPFLILKVKMIKLPLSESRVRISNNLNSKLVNRKIEEGTMIPIEVGFTDDAKDRVSAHEYVLTYLTPDKTETNRLVIFIEEDGTFFVNGEKRGKF
jgi:hypothetical protein